MSDGPHHPKFDKLIAFLAKIPAVDINLTPSMGFGSGEGDGEWWVKFAIDIDHELAWHAVQELAHVLNHIALDERLASVFKPVSPPPYQNGGPEEFLSWVIEAPDELRPGSLADLLEARLPKPVDDEAAWLGQGDEEAEEDDEGEEDEGDGPTGWIEDEDDDQDEKD